ncbi:hypothetical protein KUG47_08030 [Falsochrobactrum sp. TDYN1]|uniref:Uncharacterized protein n=1 Tax=Falsochrobactrum tianjinense TaxID=2706015 RepID=A0A949UT04_9HYPH|nr:hypothetical protein [Falsochrobactrum sp. TDYN1]MBV2143444.1 hypothetical protein [Falsochrobactrum sp. TDYN1]
MESDQTMSQRWENFRPSKTLWFWSVAGAAVLTTIVGFTIGGWTTGGTATTMATDAARNARAELVANICVERFITGPNASQKLTELKETSSYKRDTFIEDGGWVKLAGMEREASGAADLCADQLAAMDTLPAQPIDVTPETTDS